ncbi:hypothetical protein [Fibrobacter sp.]|nr:hypothetical protein [Fibrobacter sp.]MBS7273284.1 hypothetical protein [Fibrobacter sp.]MCI6438465.1 hypothetical protein [Fibrobacter sp.]
MAVTLDSLKKKIGKKNVNSRAFAWLADLEREAGNLDQALQRVDGGLTLYPNDVSAMLVRSKILFQKESYDACIQECEKVLVADPFNLAAQRIMGDAYDKLENIGERNVCYRRLHDMDPLNTFWKEEYDVVVGAAAAAAMAGEISDIDFSMPDDGNVDLSDEFTTEPAESVGAAPADEFTLNEPQAEEADVSATDVVEPAGDDPFAALASMLPGNDDADDSAMEDLSASLDSAMDAINNESAADKPLEELSEDENISSSDVGSALSDMFGLEDDLEPEEASAPAAEASSDIPASIDDNAEANAASIFGAAAPEAPAEDKPQSIDDAFGDIFGEDELPEEKPQQASIDAPADESAPAEDKPQSIDDAFGDIFGEDELPEEKPQASEPIADIAAESAAEPIADDLELPSEDGGLFEKSADADMNLTAGSADEPKADEPTTIDNAFDSIFGEDELPEEKPQTAESSADVAADLSDDLELPSEEGGLFEKSADADMNLTGNWTPDGASVEETPAIEDAFAEETLAIEGNASVFDEPAPVEEELSLPEEPAADEGLNFTADEMAPLTEEAVPALDEPAPVEEGRPSVAEEIAPALASDASFSVDNAFDSLFGSDDDLPEEKPQASEPETIAEAPATEDETVSLAEQVDQAETELEMPEVKSEDTDLAKEMGGAFASMFGNEDDDLDLPAAKTEAVPESVSNDQEATGAAIEESFGNLSEESISKDLDDSFDSLFGKDEVAEDAEILDESLTMPTIEAAHAEDTFAAAPADAPKDLDSLESEVSGAFKGLFDMDDDSLTEEDKPSNKGVDFLMSGDSDDEISAGLINNPDAPLDRGAYDLDESLNTPTLAEIYFDQGKYGKALEIYKDLAQKEPENEEIAKRKDEIEKLYNDKFGGNA